MAGSFIDGIDHLIDAVGTGELRGSVEVDQVSAHYQHDHPEFYHPDGGKAYYLQDPLYADNSEHMQRLADRLITPEGSDLEGAMIDNMESLSDKVYEQAPWEFGDLRASGHPTVTSDGEVIYDRPPHAHRLSESELREKGHLRDLFDPDRYKR